jgi:hypothetical protein
MPAASVKNKKKQAIGRADTRSGQPEPVSSPRKSKKAKPKPAAGLPGWWAHVAVAVILLFFCLVRIHLADFPLERDEGEYAYAGQLIMHGIDPYQYCYSMKLPGTAAAYAVFMAVFGQSTVGAHSGFLLVNLASCLLLYLLATRLFGRLAAVTATASFALLSLQPAVLGFAGHATQFLVMPAIAGVLLLVLATESERNWLVFCSGLCLGLSFLMKQPGAFFVLFGAFYLAYFEWTRGIDFLRSITRLGVLLLGSAVPFGFVCMLYLVSGNFRRFWFWTFHYAREYEMIESFSRGWENLRNTGSSVVASGLLIWAVAACGLIALLWQRKFTTRRVLIAAFLIFSFAAVCPGLYFRPHYFVVMLPAVSILAGVGVWQATVKLQKGSVRFLTPLPAILFVIALVITTAQDANFFFAKDMNAACHWRYGTNPFPEALPVSDFIRSRAKEGDEVAVIGSEPEIYFYSKLRSATGFVYMYPLMEPQPFAIHMQREMEREIAGANPRFVVFVSEAASWLRRDDSDSGIFDWSQKFTQQHYKLIGLVDLMGDETEFHYDEDARNYTPRSPSKMMIYEKM